MNELNKKLIKTWNVYWDTAEDESDTVVTIGNGKNKFSFTLEDHDDPMVFEMLVDLVRDAGKAEQMEKDIKIECDRCGQKYNCKQIHCKFHKYGFWKAKAEGKG